MRHTSVVGTGLLLSAALFSSCTCHKELAPISQAPPAFEGHSGWSASASATPQAHAQAPTATPAAKQPPEQVAAASTPTVPAAIPDDFPKDVPIYKGAAVTQVQGLANNAHNVIFTTSAPVTE